MRMSARRSARCRILSDVHCGDDAAGAQPLHAVLQLVERGVLRVRHPVNGHRPLTPHLQLAILLERPACATSGCCVGRGRQTWQGIVRTTAGSRSTNELFGCNLKSAAVRHQPNVRQTPVGQQPMVSAAQALAMCLRLLARLGIILLTFDDWHVVWLSRGACLWA